jgi:hypothetical protein
LRAFCGVPNRANPKTAVFIEMGLFASAAGSGFPRELSKKRIDSQQPLRIFRVPFFAWAQMKGWLFCVLAATS